MWRSTIENIQQNLKAIGQNETDPKDNLLEIRQSLSQLRQLIKEADWEDQYQTSDADIIYACLMCQDAKARKNAALLLGELEGRLGQTKSAEDLFKLYQEEETLFVKPAYLKALGSFDCTKIRPVFEEELKQIIKKETEAEEADKKHYREMHQALDNLLPEEYIAKHKFMGFPKAYQILLTIKEPFQSPLLNELKQDGYEPKAVATGIRLQGKNYEKLMTYRSFEELLLLVPVRKDHPITVDKALDGLCQSGLLKMAEELYRINEKTGPLRYTIKLNGPGRDAFTPNRIKRLTADFDALPANKGLLKNDRNHPEIELILSVKENGTCAPYVKLLWPEDHRFDYRTFTQPTSMNPIFAAEIMLLASDFLKSGIQILDPFAGTGTLLAERCFRKPAREIYALDTFGQAVKEGRENCTAAGLRVNYINRDYFDFKHDYLFDEIVTEFPDFYKKEAEDTDHFYKKFFDKSLEITSQDATLILLCREDGVLKKQLRLHPKFRLVSEIVCRKDEKLYIIKKN